MSHSAPAGNRYNLGILGSGKRVRLANMDRNLHGVFLKGFEINQPLDGGADLELGALRVGVDFDG